MYACSDVRNCAALCTRAHVCSMRRTQLCSSAQACACACGIRLHARVCLFVPKSSPNHPRTTPHRPKPLQTIPNQSQITPSPPKPPQTIVRSLHNTKPMRCRAINARLDNTLLHTHATDSKATQEKTQGLKRARILRACSPEKHPHTPVKKQTKG